MFDHFRQKQGWWWGSVCCHVYCKSQILKFILSDSFPSQPSLVDKQNRLSADLTDRGFNVNRASWFEISLSVHSGWLTGWLVWQQPPTVVRMRNYAWSRGGWRKGAPKRVARRSSSSSWNKGTGIMREALRGLHSNVSQRVIRFSSAKVRICLRLKPVSENIWFFAGICVPQNRLGSLACRVLCIVQKVT